MCANIEVDMYTLISLIFKASVLLLFINSLYGLWINIEHIKIKQS